MAEPAPTPARISVVVPHLNQPAALDRCLAALVAGRRAADEIIVVDNGSSELPAAVCERHGARLLRESEPGPGPARNTGAAAASGDILAFTDADCLPDAGWLAAVEAGLADRAVQILGGDVRVAVADPARLTPVEAYESVFGYRVARYIRHEGFTVTSNLAMRPAVLKAVGPFAGLAISEDRDWGRRATAMGYAIRYAPQMVVFHPARPDFAALARKWDRHIGHDYAETRGRPGRRRRFLLKTLAMVPSALAGIPAILLSDRLSGAMNRLRAFACLGRIRLYRAGRMAGLLAGGDPAALSGAWNREKPGN